MGFKLPGIKNHGTKASSSPLTQSLGNNLFKRTLRSRRAITTDERGSDPYGATFLPLDTRKYATSAKFPYIKSRFRVSGDASDSFEGSSGKFTRTATGGVRELPTQDEREYNRLDLRFQAPTGDGYGAMEKQARDSAKISKTVSDAYDAAVRGDISPDEYMKIIEDQIPIYQETQAQPGAWQEAQAMTLQQLRDYYQLGKDARAAEALIQQINKSQQEMAIDERDGELLPRTSLEDYLESLKPTALDERSGNFLVDGSGLMMRATEEDVAKRYKKTKK